ncbi:MAG: YihY/virulence factor BrkB family protein [Pseudomonadota bacterium]
MEKPATISRSILRKPPAVRIAKAFWVACVKLVYDGGVVIASNVAMSLLLSIFPFLMLIASLMRYYGSPEIAEMVVDLVLGHWPADSAKPIADQISVLLAQSPTEFFSFSTLVVLALATNGIENLRDGLNRAYKVRETRSFLWRRVEAVVFVAVGAIGLIASALLLVAAPGVWDFLQSRIEFLVPYRVAFQFGQYGLAVVMLWAILLALHKLLPDMKGEKRNMRWGIALTILGIFAGSKLFAFYLSTFANYTALYAGLAGMMIAIVYLYCLSVLLLFGAEFNTAFTDLRNAEKAETAREEALSKAKT